MKAHHPADVLQDLQYFGEFGGVNPSISDSSTYTFLSAKTMFDTFEGHAKGCYLYSRHTSPSNLYLGQALAALEATESAQVTASGMGSISAVLMHYCGSGDHIISARTIYGGTYALMKNFLPRFGIHTDFVDITNLEAVSNALTPQTKVIYCESLSNPLLEVSDIAALANLANQKGIVLVVDNTFTPMLITPSRLGAHVVIHSLTKFINGSSDCVAGVVCGTQALVDALRSVHDGASMLLGATLDSYRAASILKNLRTLHVRMKQHSQNALYLAEKFKSVGLKVHYPGLPEHPQYVLFKKQYHPAYGFGGMLTLDVGNLNLANRLMEHMQHNKIGYLAVSLGFYKTLFSAPGTSTSSEISPEEQEQMGLSDGLIRFSVGLDDHIERTFEKIINCMHKVGVL